jgi:hypothetical protein
MVFRIGDRVRCVSDRGPTRLGTIASYSGLVVGKTYEVTGTALGFNNSPASFSQHGITVRGGYSHDFHYPVSCFEPVEITITSITGTRDGNTLVTSEGTWTLTPPKYEPKVGDIVYAHPTHINSPYTIQWLDETRIFWTADAHETAEVIPRSKYPNLRPA